MGLSTCGQMQIGRYIMRTERVIKKTNAVLFSPATQRQNYHYRSRTKLPICCSDHVTVRY